MNKDPKNFLLNLFNSAVATAHPRNNLAQHLPGDTSRPAIVIGAGKAAAAMAAQLEQHWQGPLSGLVVTRYGHCEPCQKIQIIEASHPVPDQVGQDVANQMLALVNDLSPDDLVICLLSGGGSALLSLPCAAITLQEKQQINRALLTSGAPIDKINCVRKHLSAIKGGRLAQACWPATVHTYAISDVPGDIPDVIASGPTVADPTTSAQALAVLKQYNIEISDQTTTWLNSPLSETLKADHPCFSKNQFTIIASPQMILDNAKTEIEAAGFTALILGSTIEGESREVAKVHGAIAQQIMQYQQPVAPPCVILSGGETTVTVKGDGRGGRNAEFLLSLAVSLGPNNQVYALAADTDGIDGSEDNAGCLLTPLTYQKSQQLDLQQYLDNNDGYGFFAATNDLIITGPTRTNVNDFRAILILPPKS